MKKVLLLFLFVFSTSILLFGCNEMKEKPKKDDFGLEKAQKIEISSAKESEVIFNTIDSEDVPEFVAALKVDKWEITDIPSDETQENIYKMYQEDTIKLGESNSEKKELKEFATITTYKKSPYINFSSKNLNFSFKVPKDVAEYLSNQ
ncbi:hypothetical protein [Halalkalibacter alkalisediminis]|uniref:Lipoprotein n=1 Tax=Halalkalibacter alkalisediminis TaxID=935616 RepID=A0ABV6NKS8_9BACI|nr:hypothetical protein [Halalkalibacter alkalisediminis]